MPSNTKIGNLSLAFNLTNKKGSKLDRVLNKSHFGEGKEAWSLPIDQSGYS